MLVAFLGEDGQGAGHQLTHVAVEVVREIARRSFEQLDGQAAAGLAGTDLLFFLLQPGNGLGQSRHLLDALDLHIHILVEPFDPGLFQGHLMVEPGQLGAHLLCDRLGSGLQRTHRHQQLGVGHVVGAFGGSGGLGRRGLVGGLLFVFFIPVRRLFRRQGDGLPGRRWHRAGGLERFAQGLEFGAGGGHPIAVVSGAQPEKQRHHQKTQGTQTQPGHPGGLPVGDQSLQPAGQAAGFGQAGLELEQRPGAAGGGGRQQAQPAQQPHPAAAPAGFSIVRPVGLIGLGRFGQGLAAVAGLVEAALLFVAMIFEADQQPLLEIEIFLLLAQGFHFGFDLFELFVSFFDLPPEVVSHPFQGRQAGHGLDRHAVRMGGGDLALGQIEGVDEFVEFVAEDLVEALGHPARPAHQGFVGALGQGQARAHVAVTVEKATELVAGLVHGEFDHHRTAAFAPAEDLLQLAFVVGEGAPEQGKTDRLADGTLARFVFA